MDHDDYDSEDEFDDYEYDEDSEESCTIICPSCGADVYEDADRCPVCDDYIIARHSRSFGQPAWVVATAVVLLISMLLWFLAPLL